MSPAIDNLTGTLMEEITKRAEETSSSDAPINGNDHEMDVVDSLTKSTVRTSKR